MPKTLAIGLRPKRGFHMEGRPTKAGQVLNQLATSLTEMVGLLEETINIIRPPSAHTLPTVTATLSGVVQAAEHAALQVLDEAEALQEDRQKLGGALAKLKSRLAPDDTEGARIADEAGRCLQALSERSMKFMSAMEFQDLASQHIGRVVDSIEEVRSRLASALALFDLPEVGSERLAPQSANVIGDPTRSHGDGQALADQLLAERG
jgi:chemotaxis regulatin CheY-phosphate phosphatase CheZ